MSHFEVYIDLATVSTNTSQAVNQKHFFFKAAEPPLSHLEVGDSTTLLLWHIKINVMHLEVLVAER